jgi:hypothetical protein
MTNAIKVLLQMQVPMLLRYCHPYKHQQLIPE